MDGFFSIYLSQKTAHGCFFYLLKPEDNIWMFYSLYLLKSGKKHMDVFLFLFTLV